MNQIRMTENQVKMVVEALTLQLEHEFNEGIRVVIEALLSLAKQGVVSTDHPVVLRECINNLWDRYNNQIGALEKMSNEDREELKPYYIEKLEVLGEVRKMVC